VRREEYDNLVNFMKEKNIKVEENEQADYSNVYQGRDGEKDHYLEQYASFTGLCTRAVLCSRHYAHYLEQYAPVKGL
jgi:hypothetical protein